MGRMPEMLSGENRCNRSIARITSAPEVAAASPAGAFTWERSVDAELTMNWTGVNTCPGASVRPTPEEARHGPRLAGVALVIGFGMVAGLPIVLAADSPTEERSETTPLFSRHVVPTLSRLGCNGGGSCHGTVKGQNGFRLSLFGGQPAEDFNRLTRQFSGRRLDLLRPDESLILLKATGRVPHGGGKRTEVGSTDYQLLRAWIAGGTPFGDVVKEGVARLV